MIRGKSGMNCMYIMIPVPDFIWDEKCNLSRKKSSCYDENMELPFDTHDNTLAAFFWASWYFVVRIFFFFKLNLQSFFSKFG